VAPSKEQLEQAVGELRAAKEAAFGKAVS
jgi:hypothetical protein